MVNNIFFKTILHKGTKGDKGTTGTNFEIPTNGIIGYDGEVVPEGYEQTSAPSGSVTLIKKNITANGTYSASDDNADGYNEVVTNVQPDLTTKTITQNGTYDAADDNAQGYSSVNVNLPLTSKTITQNGTYNAASDNVEGYSSVNVNLPLTSKTITQNGTYVASDDFAAGYSSVVANVQPDLTTKTITQNGTYVASDDNAQGYSSVYVSVAGSGETFEKVASGIQGISSKNDCIWNTTAPLSIVNYDIQGYVLYDVTRKAFVVQRDFEATLVPWIKNYYAASSPCYGKLLVNNVSVAGFANNSSAVDIYGNAVVTFKLTAGDLITVMATNQNYKTTTDRTEPGWPGVGLDIYKGIPNRTQYRSLDKSNTNNAYSFMF